MPKLLLALTIILLVITSALTWNVLESNFTINEEYRPSTGMVSVYVSSNPSNEGYVNVIIKGKEEQNGK